MDRVTSFSTYNSVIGNFMRAESRQNEANVQISSGKIAADLKGFGVAAEALTAARTLKTRVEGFADSAARLSAKLDSQDQALNQLGDAGQSARGAIANAIASGRGDGLMTALSSYFGQATSAMNTKYNGRYLFAGGKVDTPPVSATSMGDLVTSSPVPPAAPWNPTPWTPDPASTFNNVFQNDQQPATSRLDESTTVTTGVLASDAATGLFDAFAKVQAFDQTSGEPFTGKLSQTQIDFLTGMLGSFDTANAGVTDTTAANGLMQARVDRAKTTQEDRKTSLDVMMGDITDVDMAEALSRLSQAQVALQASAHIFSSLQDSSLLNYLK